MVGYIIGHVLCKIMAWDKMDGHLTLYTFESEIRYIDQKCIFVFTTVLKSPGDTINKF